MSDNDQGQVEMPRYRCHKEVWALKIDTIDPTVDGGAIITPVEPGVAPFTVDRAYVDKHKPQPGGYYVVYTDGYKSWSPAKAFEEGYTLIPRIQSLHPSVANILQYFSYLHLPPHLQKVSKPFGELAHAIASGPQNAETSVALRKLLEAKDAAVRAVLWKEPS